MPGSSVCRGWRHVRVQAIQELNVKPKFWKDLLTDEAFSRKDIIHLQDPMNLSARNMQHFDHVKRNLKLVDAEEEARLRVRSGDLV